MAMIWMRFLMWKSRIRAYLSSPTSNAGGEPYWARRRWGTRFGRFALRKENSSRFARMPIHRRVSSRCMAFGEGAGWKDPKVRCWVISSGSFTTFRMTTKTCTAFGMMARTCNSKCRNYRAIRLAGTL
jgi:hypothetical protein